MTQELNVTDLTVEDIELIEDSSEAIDFCNDFLINDAVNITLELFHASRSILEANEIEEDNPNYATMFAAILASSTAIRSDLLKEMMNFNTLD
jgi:hypothetical protein